VKGGKLSDGVGRDDRAVLGVGFVVLLDIAQIVEIIDHQAEGLPAAAIGQVGRPVEPFQAGAVAEVETGDRVERRAALVARCHEVGRGGPQHRLAHPVEHGLVGPPLRPVKCSERRAISLRQRGRRLGALAHQPAREIRHRRQRNEGGKPRHLAADFRYHLFDKETAEAHPGKAALAVRNRIEHRGGSALRIDPLALELQDRGDGAGNLPGQGHLYEDQRLVDQRRVEEGVAAPVRHVDARAQIDPVADLMDRLVTDDLLQDHGRRRPVDPAQHQKSAVEPGRE